MRLVLTTLLAIGLMACDQSAIADPSGSSYAMSKEKTAGARKTTLDEMQRTYDINPGLFNDRYLGKAVEVEGKVKYILHADSLGLHLSLESNPASVIAGFLHEGAIKYAEVRKGQMLTVRCLVSSADPLNIHLNDCVLVEPNSLLQDKA